MLTKSWISLLSLTRFKLLVWDGIDDIELWFSTYLLYLRSKTLDQAKSTPCGCRRVLRQEPPNFFYFSLLFSLFSFVSDKLYLFYVWSNFVVYFLSINFSVVSLIFTEGCPSLWGMQHMHSEILRDSFAQSIRCVVLKLFI